MITLIWAEDLNHVIGNDNQLPWHLPNDLKWFKEKTSGHPVVMGRHTYESIGRLLPNRENFIISRTLGLIEGAHVLTDIQSIQDLNPNTDIFVIGGATIYEQALPFADRLMVTKINHAFEGDTFFPSWEVDEWELVDFVEGIVDDRNAYPHQFLTYERVKK